MQVKIPSTIRQNKTLQKWFHYRLQLLQMSTGQAVPKYPLSRCQLSSAFRGVNNMQIIVQESCRLTCHCGSLTTLQERLTLLTHAYFEFPGAGPYKYKQSKKASQWTPFLQDLSRWYLKNQPLLSKTQLNIIGVVP